MTMPDRSRKRPRDLNSLAASIVGDATDETPDHYTYRVERSPEDDEWIGLCSISSRLLSWIDPDKAKALAGIERLVQSVVAGKDPAAVALGRKGGLEGRQSPRRETHTGATVRDC